MEIRDDIPIRTDGIGSSYGLYISDICTLIYRIVVLTDISITVNSFI